MNYTHIAANSAGANIAARGVRLHIVSVNTKGATANLLTLYDNALGDTSGNVIAAIDTTAGPAGWRFDVDTLKGLSYVLAAGTAADITIAWE